VVLTVPLGSVLDANPSAAVVAGACVVLPASVRVVVVVGDTVVGMQRPQRLGHPDTMVAPNFESVHVPAPKVLQNSASSDLQDGTRVDVVMVAVVAVTVVAVIVVGSEDVGV
jgi:hypothetical protein